MLNMEGNILTSILESNEKYETLLNALYFVF